VVKKGFMLRFLNKYLFLPIIDFFIPNKCVNCSKSLSENNYYLCDTCYDTLKLHKNIHPESFSLFHYKDNLKFLVMKLKYDDNPKVGVKLGEKLGEKLQKFDLLDFSTPNKYFLIPVPLHKKRKKIRKYNQALYIAKGLGNILGIPIVDDLVTRTKDNISQTELSNDKERKENVKNIFKVIQKDDNLEDKIPIIIDDIITTGATTKELIKALNSNGYKNSFAISVAAPEGVLTLEDE